MVALLATIMTGAIGCVGSSGPTFELPPDPATASQESLESLFDAISPQLKSAKPGSDRYLELEAQLRTVGEELAHRSAATIRTRLAEAGRVDGMIPLGAIEREVADTLPPVKRWDVLTHSELNAELQSELAATRRAVSERESRLAETSEDELLTRINLLSELSALSGTGSERQAHYAEQRDEILRNVSKDAEEAIRLEDYEKAQDLLSIVQEVNPDDEATREKKCEVDGKVIVKRFNDALETGRVNRTMEMLINLSQTDCFSAIRQGLASEAGQMADAFGMLGQESSSAGDLADAYQRYRDASVVSTLLLEREADLPGIDDFISKIDKRYDRAFKAGEYGVAWGYLNVMTEFGPTTPQIRQRLRKTRDEIARRAVHGLTAYPFEDTKSTPTKVGDAVSSKVVQHIFRTIPSDVRIVEREQLERILDECKRSGSCNALDTADFIVQGTILDAKVETTEKTSSETRRVVTGRETVTNPDHTRWSQLRERERDNTPEPPRTLERDVTEDVTIEVNNVRKVGIISVSYRVVEARSGRVLFTDSIQTKQEFQDEGRQGLQLGNFQQETDFVELPPDIEILSGNDGLADKVSEEIGIKLVDFLKDPEEQYSVDAKRFLEEGDYIGAARKAAYTIVLRENKSKDMGTLPDDLKTYAVESPAL
jgi:curli biogenesis system outer membrane secretion channel CsgG